MGAILMNNFSPSELQELHAIGWEAIVEDGRLTALKKANDEWEITIADGKLDRVPRADKEMKVWES